MHKELCLLITNTRSRSTFFLDFIRAMKSVEMAKRYTVFRQLFLGGRRYPLDLANIVSGEYDMIEMAPHLFQKLPRIILKQKTKYYVEKIHPHFIKLPYWLFRLVLKLRYRNYKCVYLVRKPEASLRSYLKYCQNNPEWGEAKHKTPDFITKQYERIYRLYKLLGGMVFINDELDELEYVSQRLGDYLGIDGHDVNKHVSDFHKYNDEIYALRREQSPFVSDDIPIDLEPYSIALAQARHFYDKLSVIAESSKRM